MNSLNFYTGCVLINAADTITGFNAARSIANNGFQIYGQANNPDSIFLKSKIWSEVFIKSPSSENFIEISKIIVREQTKKCFKPVLLLNQDHAVNIASTNQKALAEYFSFQLPEPESTTRMMDKTQFQEWTEKNNILSPKSCIVDTREQVSKAFDKLKFPIIVKPLLRSNAWDSKYTNKKAFKVAKNPNDIDFYSKMLEYTDRLIFQEWVEGHDNDIYFVLAHIGSKRAVSYCGKKVTQWPTLTGSTSSCISHEDHKLEEMGLNILRMAGLRGLGSIEFKKDQTNGNYYVIEPTVGRNDYQSFIATTGNQNLNLYYTLDCLGYSYWPNKNLSPAIWIDEMGFLRSIRFPNTSGVCSEIVGKLFTHKISLASLSRRDLLINLSFIKKLCSSILSIFRKTEV